MCVCGRCYKPRPVLGSGIESNGKSTLELTPCSLISLPLFLCFSSRFSSSPTWLFTLLSVGVTIGIRLVRFRRAAHNSLDSRWSGSAPTAPFKATGQTLHIVDKMEEHTNQVLTALAALSTEVKAIAAHVAARLRSGVDAVGHRQAGFKPRHDHDRAGKGPAGAARAGQARAGLVAVGLASHDGAPTCAGQPSVRVTALGGLRHPRPKRDPRTVTFGGATWSCVGIHCSTFRLRHDSRFKGNSPGPSQFARITVLLGKLSTVNTVICLRWTFPNFRVWMLRFG